MAMLGQGRKSNWNIHARPATGTAMPEHPDSAARAFQPVMNPRGPRAPVPVQNAAPQQQMRPAPMRVPPAVAAKEAQQDVRQAAAKAAAAKEARQDVRQAAAAKAARPAPKAPPPQLIQPSTVMPQAPAFNTGNAFPAVQAANTASPIPLSPPTAIPPK